MVEPVHLIDYELHLVIVRTSSEREMTIYDEGTRVGLAFCCAARAMGYFKQGCTGYLAYVVDVRNEKIA